MSDLAERVRAMPCVYDRHGEGWQDWLGERLEIIAAVRALEAEVAALRRVREAAQEALDNETDLFNFALTETRNLRAALEAARA